jgi:hypothetical protein
MAPTKEVERATQPLDARQLSLMRPAHAVSDPDTDATPDPRFMCVLSEHGALPVDLAARLVRCTTDEIEQMIIKGVKLGWVRYKEFPQKHESWVFLREGGWRQAGKESGRAPPKAGLLEHRREVIEAQLLFRDKMPNWSWTCESAFRQHDNTGLTIPDGVLEHEGTRWAIEVERSTKLPKKLRKKLKTLCADYDKVIYLGSRLVRRKLERLQPAGDFSKLETRPLPSGKGERRKWTSKRGDYEPSAQARQVLNVINEDGILAKAQLPRVLGWTPEETEPILWELEGEDCIRRDLQVSEEEGWIWCSHRGAVRSGTGLQPLTPPSRGELVKRIVLTEVRLHALERWPEALWITRRRLEKGHTSKPAGIPRAAVEKEGRRHAVLVLEAWQDPKKLIARLKQWKKDYPGGVLCYRARKMTQWVDDLVKKHKLDWVEVRDLPTPPPSAPYQALEDEWRTGREVYRPVGYEVSLLWLINTEGMISEMQLPRVLGCSPEVVKRLIAPLLEYNCLERKNGWIYCKARGGKMSGTEMAEPLIPMERYREQRVQLMEVRLSQDEPVSCEDWKTNRQLALEKKKAGEKKPTNRWPNAAVRIDGQWHAIALVFREFRRTKLVKQLSRWAKEHGRVRCYCADDDVEPFRKYLKGQKISSVEVMSLPTAPEGPARERQEAFKAALMEEKERREARDHHKFLAQKAVADAVRTGKLKKPDRCEICGEKIERAKLQGHHEDYSKPLQVRWLCAKCHSPEDQARRECEARNGQQPTRSTGQKRRTAC